MSELKPCPCCGSENIEVKYIGNSHTKSRKVEIKCKSCRLTRVDGAIYHDHEWCYETAKKFWNTRASDNTITEKEKVISELIDALSGIHDEAVNYQFRTGKPVTWCLKIGELLAKHKQPKGE